jgi:integrase
MGQVIEIAGRFSSSEPTPKVRGPYVLQEDDDHRITMTIWRRHRPDCPHRAKGRDSIKCTCPIWGDGCVDSVRVLRQSLATRNMRIARRRLGGLLEDYLESLNETARPSAPVAGTKQIQEPQVAVPPEPKAIAPEDGSADLALLSNATKAYLASCKTNGIGEEAFRKYRNSLNKLVQFAESDDICRKRQVQKVADLKVVDLDRFRAGRKLAKITASKEWETIKAFFEFCVARELCRKNITAMIKGPTIVDQNDVVPYTTEEVNAIIDACSTFGQYDYERKRALAVVLTLRFTALRISDIALLRRDRISQTDSDWRIFIRTVKNNAAVYLLIPQILVDALNDVPPPGKSGKVCRCYFWNGVSKPKSQISEVSETLAAVFRKSGVQDAGAHRFRHTLATELVGEGASFVEVADILGNSPEIVEKHYAKSSKKRQERVDTLMKIIHETAPKTRSEKS